MRISRTYSELSKLRTFEERFEYLKLNGLVGSETFGFDRYINQGFYRSPEWKRARREVILRDNGCDLGIPGMPIRGQIIVHHMNPICEDDVLEHSLDILKPEFLICVSLNTHNALHYSGETPETEIKVRTPNDMCPWKK